MTGGGLADGLDLPREDFAAFYKRNRPKVYQVLLLMTGSQDRAVEVTDEAFARAFARWDRVAVHPQPTAWVIRTACNQYKKLWRRVWTREFPVDLGSVELAAGLDFQTAAPAAAAVDPALLRALNHLPRRQREVMALRYLADLTPEQTANALGIAVKTVSVHHHRAMKTLREQLQVQGGDDHGYDGDDRAQGERRC